MAFAQWQIGSNTGMFLASFLSDLVQGAEVIFFRFQVGVNCCYSITVWQSQSLKKLGVGDLYHRSIKVHT